MGWFFCLQAPEGGVDPRFLPSSPGEPGGEFWGLGACGAGCGAVYSMILMKVRFFSSCIHLR